MPRPPREELAGGVFHVYARGNDRRRVFFDRRDRLDYLARLRWVARKYGWNVLAYCLMDNHLHLVIETQEPNLGRGMQSLHGYFAQRLNKRRGRSGHLFQGPYGCVPIETDEQLWVTLRYLALNPVDAGMCAGPRDYEWSSYGRVVSGELLEAVAAERLFELLSGSGRSPRATYRTVVEGEPKGV